jgi:hypothetical protein
LKCRASARRLGRSAERPGCPEAWPRCVLEQLGDGWAAKLAVPGSNPGDGFLCVCAASPGRLPPASSKRGILPKCWAIHPECSQNVVFLLENEVFGAFRGDLPRNPSKMLPKRLFPFGKRRSRSISWGPIAESVQKAPKASFFLWKTRFLGHFAGTCRSVRPKCSQREAA